MKRFIALALLGGIAALAGHATISLGLHPERLAPAAALLQGCAALAAGTALFVTGMLGLADGYEKTAGRFALLLDTRQPLEATPEGVLGDRQQLAVASEGFWRGYASTGAGIALFMAGLIGLTLALARTSPALFTVGLLAGIACLAVAASALCLGGLRRLRRAQAGVDRSARLFSRQPERTLEEPEPRQPKRAPRYTLFPRGTARAGRQLDRLSRGATARTR